MQPNRHVDFLSEKDKVKWLLQRGWIPEGIGYREPDTGVTFMFSIAVERAKKECKFPADFELNLPG